MKIKIQHIVFVMWLVGISWYFAYFLYNAEHFAKMHIHDFDGAANLLFAFVTAVVFGVLKLLKRRIYIGFSFRLSMRLRVLLCHVCIRVFLVVWEGRV